MGGPRRAWRWAILVVVSAAIVSVPWWGARLVPPLNLSLEHRAVSVNFNRERRQPLVTGETFRLEELDEGLYAYTAIRAPLGLGQPIYHYWFHGRELVDKVPLSVTGGREQGYRTWSHKLHFPDNASGRWRVEVRTAKEQIIGVLRFNVIER